MRIQIFFSSINDDFRALQAVFWKDYSMAKRVRFLSAALSAVFVLQATGPAFCQVKGLINDAKNLGKAIGNGGKQPQSTGVQPTTAPQANAPVAATSAAISPQMPSPAASAPNSNKEPEEYTDYRTMANAPRAMYINEHLRGKMSLTQQAHWDQLFAIFWKAGAQPIIKEQLEAIAREGVTGELADALVAVWNGDVESGYSKVFPNAYRLENMKQDELIAYISEHLIDKTTLTQKAMWQQFLLDSDLGNQGTFQDLNIEDLRAIAREGLSRDLHEALYALCGGYEGGNKFLPKNVTSDNLLRKFSALPANAEIDRRDAVIAMAGMHDPMIIQQLLSSLASDPSRDVRLMAVRALVGIADSKVSEALTHTVKVDQSGDVRQRALWALYITGDTHVKETATSVMEDEDSSVAELANSILNKMAGISPAQIQELAKQRAIAREYDVPRLLPLGIREKAPAQQRLFGTEMQKALVSASAAASLPNIIAKKAKVQDVRDGFLQTFREKVSPTKLDDWVGRVFIEEDEIRISISDVDLGYGVACPLEKLKDKSQIANLANKDWVVFSATANEIDINTSGFLANPVRSDGYVDLGRNFIIWNSVTLTKLRKIETNATQP